MASFSGKWRLVAVEGVQEFQEAIHTPEDYKKRLRELYGELKSNPNAYIEELQYDKAAGKIHRKVTIKGELKRELTVPIGADYDTTTMDGRKITVKVTVESDSKATLHEKGENFELDSTFEVQGQSLILTNKTGSIVSTMKYERA